MVRGLDRTRRDSTGSDGDDRADGERSFEMQPVPALADGEVGDSGDEELVVHREEEDAVEERPKKLKTLFGLPPIVMMKLY